MEKDVCPICHNAVIGKFTPTATRKWLTTLAKKGGMKAVLAAAGSAIPGFGNVAGFVAGAALDVIYGDDINKLIDYVADLFEENKVYIFSCPNCGHEWSKTEEELFDDEEYEFFDSSDESDEDYSLEDSQDDDDYEDESETSEEENIMERAAFEMEIEDVFNITGRGVVITGRVSTGCIYVGETINISGATGPVYTVVVTGVEMFGKLLDSAEEGDHCGLVIRGVDKSDIKPGMVASHTLHLNKRHVPNQKASHETIEPTPKQDNTENEETYVAEYRQCLADGVISSAEIRLLKKLATSLGISEERANELEMSCKSVQLTDAEKQYLEEYKACLEDCPEISASTRRLLNRLASSLNLTEEQISRLENI